MADPQKMSLEEILAACRGEGAAPAEAGDAEPVEDTQPAAETPAAETPAAETPAAETPAAETPAASKPKAAAAGGAKKPAAMNVADILAAARSSDGEGAGSVDSSSGQASEAAATGGKKATEMSVADIMAAARGGGQPKAKAAPAKKAAPSKPAAAAKPKAAAPPVDSGPKDTSSILAAARKSVKPGPMSKEEAKKLAIDKPAAPAAKTMPVRPEKPAYAKVPTPRPASDADDRRSFMTVLMGSFMAVGFTSLTITHMAWLLGLARFMFPNVLTEPPSRFKIGFPGDFAPDTVDASLKAQFGVWVVNTEYEGQRQIFALRSVCTHLGCTPNWLEAEQKFKCPCHGSGFYKDGINFEGPAPRPLERYAIQVSDDGQIEVDKSRTFQQEMGQWKDSACFVDV